jgi:hypothetical protein
MDLERIKLDNDDAVAGTELMSEVKEEMGDRYDDCKAALDEVKGQIPDQFADNDEEKAEYQRYWPFE